MGGNVVADKHSPEGRKGRAPAARPDGGGLCEGDADRQERQKAVLRILLRALLLHRSGERLGFL